MIQFLFTVVASAILMAEYSFATTCEKVFEDFENNMNEEVTYAYDTLEKASSNIEERILKRYPTAQEDLTKPVWDEMLLELSSILKTIYSQESLDVREARISIAIRDLPKKDFSAIDLSPVFTPAVIGPQEPISRVKLTKTDVIRTFLESIRPPLPINPTVYVRRLNLRGGVINPGQLERMIRSTIKVIREEFGGSVSNYVDSVRSDGLIFEDLSLVPDYFRHILNSGFENISRIETAVPGVDLHNFASDNVTLIFLKGFDVAKQYAKSRGAETLTFRGTGILAKSLDIVVNPIELQEITIRIGGQDIVIGQILPEAEHLRLLKSSEEIYNEIKALIEIYLGS